MRKVFYSIPFAILFFLNFLHPWPVMAQTVFTYSGILTNGAGIPVSNVMVNLGGQNGSSQALTNAAGAFSLYVPSGTYALSLQSNGVDRGVVPTYFQFSTDLNTITVNSDTIQDLTIPTQTLTVTVLDSLGKPVTNTTVGLGSNGIVSTTLFENMTATSNPITANGYSTNTFGVAVIPFLPSLAELSVNPPDGSNLANKNTDISFTGTSSITITLAHTFTYSGILTNGYGIPIVGMNIILGNETYNKQVITDNAGYFSLHVPSGAYTLVFQSISTDPNVSPTLIQVYTDRNIIINSDTTQDLLLPTRNLTVTVLGLDGNPLPNTRIALSASSDDVLPFNIFLNEIANAAGGSMETKSVYTNSLGIAVIPFLPTSLLTVDAVPQSEIGLAPKEIYINFPDAMAITISYYLNHPPTANAGGPYSVAEGSSVTLSGSGSDSDNDPITFAWDLNNDGIFETQGQNPVFSAAGVVVGDHTVILQVCDDKNACTTASTIVTVAFANRLTTLNPAKVWIGLKNSDDVGIKFDLQVEAYVNGNLVSTGELDSVSGGSGGFNNAHLQTIPFNSFSSVDFPTGSTLSIKVYVRNACGGSGHNSGTARLWYNDTQANSQFGSTIGTNTYNDYLLNNFVLGTSVGPGPKKTVDVSAGAKCSTFKPFGTWIITP
jgi:hypothetical protein